MGAVNYATVFSALDHPYRNLWVLAPGLIIVALGLVGLLTPSFFAVLSSGRLMRSRFGPWFSLLFGIVFTIDVGIGTAMDSWTAVRALKLGNYLTVEGRVSDFRPMPHGGHQKESFKVNGIHFSYSDFELTAGFNRTSSYGGPIRENLPVRISYRNGEILKLEIAR